MNKNDSNPPAPRLPLEMNVEFRKSYARQSEVGVLNNISLTGAFLKSKSLDAQPDDKLLITFTVSGRIRKIQATIVWSNTSGCGIRFQPFNNRDLQIVDDLMYFVENRRENRREVLENIFKRVS